MSPEEFIQIALCNPVNAALASRLPSLDLDECHLTAGCLFQTVWNCLTGRPAEWGVKDYDVFYFDDDISWEAEDAVIQRAKGLFSDLNATIEIKNQARVHLWYEQRFGGYYPPLQSARDGIDRYLIECTCVGIDMANGELYAPYGLQDIHDGILRINPRNRRPDLSPQKALDYQARWPWLTIALP